MDHFPYTRFYRGQYMRTEPTVFDREAGWRPVRNMCYTSVVTYREPEYPNHCFETACSTVYPCYPGYLHKYSDKEQLEVMLNHRCIDKSP